MFSDHPVPARFQREGVAVRGMVLDPRKAEDLTYTATLRQWFSFPDRYNSVRQICVLPVRDETRRLWNALWTIWWT